MILYRVEWRSLSTGLVGHGEWDQNLNIIQTLVDYGNKEYPDIIHWIGKKETT